MALRAFCLGALVVLTACGGKQSKAPHSANPTSVATEAGEEPGEASEKKGFQPEGAFYFATPRVIELPVPARFSAPLPSHESHLERALDFPPEPFVRYRIQAGNAEMRRRLLDAMRLATKAGPLADRLLLHYQEVVTFWPSKEVCSWLGDLTKSGEKPRVKVIVWQLAEHCRGVEYAPLFQAAAVPDRAVVNWYFRQFGEEPLELTPRLERAAAAVARSKSPLDARYAGVALARTRGLRAIAVARSIQAKLSSDEARAQLGIAFMARKEPEARTMGLEACAHPSTQDDPLCHEEPKGPAAAGPSASEIARLPRDQALSALDACARTANDSHERRNCLEELAVLDRASAARLAAQAKLDQRTDDPGLVELSRTLLHFTDAEDVERHLAMLGFTPLPADRRIHYPGDELDPSEAPDLTSIDFLAKLGRIHAFDAETDQFPNEHDGLLFELAAIAWPALEGVLFEELPPPRGEGDYVLRAYMDGRVYELDATNSGDWYDLVAVLGLLNALSEARGSEMRFASLPTGGQDVLILAGPAKGILSLAADRLLTVERADVANEEADTIIDLLEKSRQP